MLTYHKKIYYIPCRLVASHVSPAGIHYHFQPLPTITFEPDPTNNDEHRLIIHESDLHYITDNDELRISIHVDDRELITDHTN